MNDPHVKNESRPEFCTDGMLEFLDALKASETCNMYESPRMLDGEFPQLTADRRRNSFTSSPNARAVFKYWCDTYEERTKLRGGSG